ncbi:hypothetical protein A2331_05155 [Candidatus Falkowbacteria bacterium RIFOXYB2_FULL_34_18]|uniref:Glycosyl transferase family 1 domain-containing protein n=1 Tax=Candidatus Falkowbacteria bacterium RIFOXYD2_FULL_34_120 TaxID=1798007 RepID=A0A1F5TNG1_9BACT|nr:MAG: hypothetical protein A2500_07090 [Candidatus Falkowbacteria bacterium RIFOXYC12_FULL_34_55]OGF28733.1 MAG: hypothetical protein A2331_05155 [Candidatus Falkowbacteria bacterium RIFOXYB2_FULL_34_18]OGF38098.1 MAG: hypothetical protein A2466_04335 [Candidatus Falkowbacteria bacterium RIFOXYC2_FULL_34_220]OGF38352.1 MAG: hypothetical protein A2515_06365 [Candidatus Falkowbacteria bacterium RIFOXYD12_FULL_34_57]OGF40339.1 MAG: hypothetical protein A2531_00625 [Candidatus Falkowbacteria bact
MTNVEIMKIGIDIRSLMDCQYSGVSLYALNLVRGILKLDKKNTYKLYYNSFENISGRLPEFKYENVEVVNTGYPNKVFNYIMQKGAGQPKLDQLLDVDLFFMPHLNFASFSEKCKKIITIHDLSFVRYKEFFSVRKNIWHWFLNIKKTLKEFDVIVAVSENTKRDIVEFCNIDEKMVKVIYSGVDKKFRVINERDKLKAIKEKYKLPDKFILYLGNLEPRKNIEGLIEAFDLLKDLNYSLVIAGGKGWRYEKIFRTFEKAKNKNRIQFLDYVSECDKVCLYNLASLFVFPSFYEGFGFPPLEALACGTPVITSNSSSLTEVVRDGAVLVNPYNINEIALAMEAVLKDVDLQKKLIDRGLDIISRFSWDKTFREYLKIFQNF